VQIYLQSKTPKLSFEELTYPLHISYCSAVGSRQDDGWVKAIQVSRVVDKGRNFESDLFSSHLLDLREKKKKQ
jgi:hypothetical protein